MPYCCTSALRARQSSWVGMATSESANSWRTLSVAGSHTWSVYLSKNSPEAYFDSGNPANQAPRSRAMAFDERSAW